MSDRKTVWTLTCEHNDYNQHGEYFIEVFDKFPTVDQLLLLDVPRNRLRHVMNGGGRVDYEDEWFYLRERGFE
jgi:hypothetical protein